MARVWKVKQNWKKNYERYLVTPKTIKTFVHVKLEKFRGFIFVHIHLFF